MMVLYTINKVIKMNRIKYFFQHYNELKLECWNNPDKFYWIGFTYKGLFCGVAIPKHPIQYYKNLPSE